MYDEAIQELNDPMKQPMHITLKEGAKTKFQVQTSQEFLHLIGISSQLNTSKMEKDMCAGR